MSAGSAGVGSSAPLAGSEGVEPVVVTSFPAFRSEEWIRTEFDRLRAPTSVLEGVGLNPQFMTDFPSVGLYPTKVAQVQEQIRTALFRQALFKVQNVEVTHLEDCRDDRLLQRVAGRAGGSLAGRLLDARNPPDVQLLHEEVWTIDRCRRPVEYHVRYYKEGGDGFSAFVLPAGLQDMWRALRYYYSPG
ncbi:unnamed protein product [Prorocentrum cordatum]|uniref:Uncharacterized protein n=1 Tax=Prorocentrum cordatum TaxID=2364126 RepID=A0ABN9RM45_9DINO|nr:unnamed protein product [Polarella glacialis]